MRSVHVVSIIVKAVIYFSVCQVLIYALIPSLSAFQFTNSVDRLINLQLIKRQIELAVCLNIANHRPSAQIADIVSRIDHDQSQLNSVVICGALRRSAVVTYESKKYGICIVKL